MAIGTRDWMPKEGRPAMRIVRFTDALLTDDVITADIENVPVKVFGVAKTIADCFRHRRKVGQTVALEGLLEALRQRKASPAEIARHAERGGVATVVRPYLEALTANALRRSRTSGPRFGPASFGSARRRARISIWSSRTM